MSQPSSESVDALPKWEKHTTAAGSRVPLLTKIAYGAGGMADFLVMTVPTNMAVPVYAKHFGMDTGLLGLAKAIPRIIAAFSDSLMGGISDNARTKWGRRKPFILVGAVLCAMLMPWVWFPPAGAGSWGMFLYIGCLMAVYTVAYSIFFVPYQALGLELSTDYDERTRVQAWKGYISGIGFFMAPWFFWFCTRDFFPSIVEGARALSVVMGAVIVIGAVLTICFCKEETATMRQEKIAVLPALKLTLKNRPFLLLQGAAVFMGLAISCGNTVGFYLILDYVCKGDEKFFGLLGGVTGTVANLMTYVGMAMGVWVSTHLGKRTTGLLGLILVLIGGLLVAVFLAPRYSWLPWVPVAYHPWFTMIPGIVINLGLQTCNLMFSSMTADVCDEDEISTGLRREGAYVAVAGVFHKVMGVTMLVVGGFMPYLAGYTNMALRPTEGQLVAMKWILIAVQAIASLAAIAFLFLYPITRHRAEETRRILDERRQTGLPS